ncbi:hypothetical protein N6H14_28315 [Paenibacillus sp. CC-CFT747]|nr:hypothetical protein N6H14_28315 [Paenibacillus sp. CC-CFT747]
MFTDGDIPIIGCAEELYGLYGIRFSQLEAVHGEVSVEIELDAPAKVLIGYFHSPESQWLQPVESGKGTEEPSASGIHFPVIRKGIRLFSYPSVDIHAVSYAAGRHTLCYGKGAYLIIGVVKATQPMTAREYDPNKDDRTTLDWLYEKAREVTVL